MDESKRERETALKRAAFFSSSYYRFFGARYGREQMPSGLRPMSCGETARALRMLPRNDAPMVRRCLAQMVASGYIPDEHNSRQFRDLVQDVVRKIKPRASAEEAYAYLREKGLRDYAAPSEVDGKLTVPANPPNEPIPGPTMVTFSGDIFTASKEILIPFPFRTVRRITDPRNWGDMGPFWKTIDRKWEKPDNGRDPNVEKGKVFERFVVNWNQLLLQEFKVWLRFTRRTTDESITTDYSLIYEEQDQLLVDQGYGEVRRIPNHPGWTRYTGVKTLKFASSLLNLLAPAVMAMFLDGNVAAFYTMFKPKRPKRS